MNKNSKIQIVLLLFSITSSITIFYLFRWRTNVGMAISIIGIFASIYGGAFAAIQVTYEKFMKLSFKHIDIRFFAVFCTLSVVIFIAASYLVVNTIPLYIKPDAPQEQVRRAYLYHRILRLMPVKMFVGSFIGMLLAIKTTDINKVQKHIEF